MSATLFHAHRVGIDVFATGGIGGVHRGVLPDVSTDLPALASIPGCVVCAGAKSVLDLPATRERLETDGICVVGFGCDEFPAFYSRESGLEVDVRVDSPEQVADMIRERDRLRLSSSILVACPCPGEHAIPRDEIEAIISNSQIEVERQAIRGKDVTPFLLGEVARRSEGRSLAANRALLLNNARVAAGIATALT